jgi:hypothetical protein
VRGHGPQSGLIGAPPGSDRRQATGARRTTHDHKISSFPAPWRIVELPNGFAVEDATGKQIGVFYGRAPDSAGHTGIMTMDEARQIALDFAKLPELLRQRRTAG